MKSNTKNAFSLNSDHPINSIFQLWLGTWSDTILTFFGLLAAILSGICIPGIIILYGNLTEVFVQYEIGISMGKSKNGSEIPVGFRRTDSPEIGSKELAKQTLHFSLSSAALALAQLVFTTMYIICLNRAAVNCSNRARLIYFEALLHQSISWFDLQDCTNLANNSIRDSSYLEASLGEKLGTFVSSTIAACTCTFVALYYGHILASALFTAVPMVVIIIYVAKRINDFMKKQETSFYKPAETLIRESFANVRSILAYSGESNEGKKYGKLLSRVEDVEVTRGAINSFAAAALWAIIYCMYGFAFWRGVELMSIDHNYTVTTLIVVFFCVQIGVLHILQLPQYMFLIVKSSSASSNIIGMIKRIRIPRRKILTDLEGRVGLETSLEFRNVEFAYQSRMTEPIFRDVSFGVRLRTTTAILGASNSGKSTCLALIHKFYEPQRGSVILDGVDVREFPNNWLRRHVGYAQQCPVLFGTTIGEGITCHSPYKSPVYLETVSKVVGFHSVVMELTEKYNCPLTTDLPVDQRQRLALARVLYRKPHILLIDNALSSLSFDDEANVYDSIRTALPSLTILIVTNNRKILQKVDKILYVSNGNVNEYHSLEDLVHAQPEYKKLISDRSDVVEDMDIETTLKCKHAASKSKIILSNSSSFAGRSYQELLRSELVRIGRYPVFFNVTDIPSTENVPLGEVTFTKMRKLLIYNRKEWLQLLLACIAAAILGFSLPIYTVLFGETLSLVALHNGVEFEIRLNFFTNMFFVAGFVSGISTIIQGYMLSVSGSKLTTNIRKRALKRILQQNMEWFDCETNNENGTNDLLRTSAARIQQACGQRIVFNVQAVTSLTVSIVLSMSYSWKMGLVTVIFTPLSLLLLRYNNKLQLRKNVYTSIYLNRTKEIIVETVTNAKCIAALNLENAFLVKYRDELQKLVTRNRKEGLYALIYGTCVALPAIAYAVSMFYGGHMLKNDEIEIGKVFKVAEAIILGTLMVGHLVFFAPNITKAQIAAVKLLRLIEKPGTDLVKRGPKSLSGRVTFDGVSFQHPHYAGLPKLKKFSIDLQAGESLGLVGLPHSGVFIPAELILGFYRTTSGKITFDGEPEYNFDTKNLRMQIGLVEGDPSFFKRTIAKNISYGDLSREIRMEEIVRISRKVFLHDFIITLPKGYRTVLDEKIELTISQKILLSLARALVRNPKILVFLDLKRGESEDAEFILRKAIKAATQERTSIISSCDPFSAVQLFQRLLVINRGMVEETGNHEGLLKARGLYTKLCSNSHSWN